MSTEFTPSELKGSLEHGSEFFGHFATWDVPSLTVNVSAIKSALESAGISTDIPELRAVTAFGRATKDLRKSKLIRKRSGKKDETRVFQLNDINTGAGEILEYDYNASVELDPESGAVRCGEDRELAKTIGDAVSVELCNRTASDVTRLVKTLFERNADLFPFNRRKGVAYFCPQEHVDFLERVCRFLKEIGGEIITFPVPKGTQAANEAVRGSVQSGLDSMLDELREATEEWEKGSTRGSTMEKAKSRLDAIFRKAEMYSTYLGCEKAKLLESCNRTREVMLAKIAAISVPEPETEEDKPEPKPAKKGPTEAAKRKAKKSGWDCFDAGVSRESNPHNGTELEPYWLDGWTEAQSVDLESAA